MNGREFTQTLARIILDAQATRENSYDWVAATAQEKLEDLERKEHPEAWVSTDWARYYRKTQTEAAREACERGGVPELEELLTGINHAIWSDAQFWAAVQLKKEQGNETV